jgi:hypothetical protein
MVPSAGYLTATIMGDLTADEGAVPRSQLPPLGFAKLNGMVCGKSEVDKEKRRQQPLRGW